jgi:hypothetical protein
VRAFHAVFSRWRRPCATFLLCAARLFFLRQMGLALAARAPPRQLFRARVAGARGPAPSAPYPLPWRLRGVGEGAREPANNPYLRPPPSPRQQRHYGGGKFSEAPAAGGGAPLFTPGRYTFFLLFKYSNMTFGVSRIRNDNFLTNGLAVPLIK